MPTPKEAHITWILKDEVDPETARVVCRALLAAVLGRATTLSIDAISDNPDAAVPQELLSRARDQHQRRQEARSWLRFRKGTPSLMAIELDPRLPEDVATFAAFMLESINAEALQGNEPTERLILSFHDSGQSVWGDLLESELESAAAELRKHGIDLYRCIARQRP